MDLISVSCPVGQGVFIPSEPDQCVSQSERLSHAGFVRVSPRAQKRAEVTFNDSARC